MTTIRDTSVCVTGGAGFLGSHLVNHLIDDRGCSVVVLDNLCVGRREFVHPKATFIHCDITKSESTMCRIMKDHKVKFAFSYAAWPYIPDSFARPLHVFEVNATGAIQFINAAQEAGVDRILQVSSAEIYGDHPKDGPYFNDLGPSCLKLSETDPVTPHSTYGVAKAAVDSYVQCAWKERRTPAIALRQFNCVGERETHPYVIPEIIGQFGAMLSVRQNFDGLAWAETNRRLGISTTAVIKLGNNSFRDFLYAGDAVRIAVELLERGKPGEVYNLGSETGIKIYDLAKLIGKVMGFADVQVVEDETRKRPWEIWFLMSANDKLYSIVDRRKLVGLEDALRKTVAWYESNGRKWAWEV